MSVTKCNTATPIAQGPAAYLAGYEALEASCPASHSLPASANQTNINTLAHIPLLDTAADTQSSNTQRGLIAGTVGVPACPCHNQACTSLRLSACS